MKDRKFRSFILVLSLALVLSPFQNCSKFDVIANSASNSLALSSSPNASSGPCLFNGKDVPEGANITSFSLSSVPYGQTCQSEVRTCTEGVLSGSFGYLQCAVSATPQIKKISSGQCYSCALVDDKVKCWGYIPGIFAANPTSNVPADTPITELTGVTDFSVNSYYAECHIISGALTCTGVSDLSSTGKYFSQTLLTSDVSSLALDLAGNVCALIGTQIQCWYRNSSNTYQAPFTAFSDPHISQYSINVNNGCAVTDGGQVQCWNFKWDQNFTSWLGANPSTIFINSGATRVAVGFDGGNCAIVNGNLYCWANYAGSGGYAQPDGTLGSSTTPVLVMIGVTDLTLSHTDLYISTCVVKTDTSLQCWQAPRELPSSAVGTPAVTLMSGGAVSLGALTFATLNTLLQVGESGNILTVQTTDGSVKSLLPYVAPYGFTPVRLF